MNNRQLEYFVEVYKTGSIKRAAEKFFISPQGMSKMIINLEEECGKKLFIRSGNVLTPTAYADHLYPHANLILDEYAYIASSGNYYERLSICTVDGLIECLPDNFLKDFFNACPDINLDILETSHDDAVDHLVTEKCELALIQTPYNLPGYINEFVFSYQFCMGVSKDNPLSKNTEFADACWDGQCIASRGLKYPLYKNFVQLLNAKGIYPRTLLESNNDRILLSMAENDAAFACVSNYVAKAYTGDKLVFLPIPDPTTHDRIYMCYKQKKRMKGDALLKFRDFLMKSMGQAGDSIRED